MDRFWELMGESVIVQGLITLVLIVTACYLAATAQPIPDLIGTALMLVLGFYFGQKTQLAVANRVRRLGNESSDNSPGIADRNGDS